ncbi:hypothetical protein GN244_ATG13025 [Phytophthora infestans]|uniref:Uncharacterized protein n=1 Tax=Phytophthora infestans TaxID=4787 RepID=A0A833SPM6_PHYIN|nr:hypothetical protein GN244_ATG13025 [Phytophthora infestans]
MVLSMPTRLQVQLTVKVGQPYTNSRTTYGAPIIFEFMPNDGLDVLRAKISSSLATYTDITWEADAPILIRPSANASQSNYVPLPALQSAFTDRINRLWNQASRRRNGQADFQLELFIYVQRANTSTGIRRATESRLQQQLRYWAISHARQSEGTPLEPPTNATFSQLQRVDAMQFDIIAQQENNSDQRQFVRVSCRLNGGVISLNTDVVKLRQALGLHSYNLFPPFRADLDTTYPTENIDDDEDAAQ